MERRRIVAILALACVCMAGCSSAVASATPTVEAPVSSSAPTPMPSASALELANPGGTCVASQFVLGTAMSEYEPSVLGARHVGVFQPMRNAGGQCVLRVPYMVGLVSAEGSLQTLRADPGGNVVCVDASPGGGVERTCRTVYHSAYTIRRGESVSIETSLSWPDGTLYTPPPCPGPIDDVTRFEFPLATGTIEINFESQVHLAVVCSSTVLGFSVVEK